MPQFPDYIYCCRGHLVVGHVRKSRGQKKKVNRSGKVGNKKKTATASGSTARVVVVIVGKSVISRSQVVQLGPVDQRRI